MPLFYKASEIHLLPVNDGSSSHPTHPIEVRPLSIPFLRVARRRSPLGVGKQSFRSAAYEGGRVGSKTTKYMGLKPLN